LREEKRGEHRKRRAEIGRVQKRGRIEQAYIVHGYPMETGIKLEKVVISEDVALTI
jgi:hypothetical protein